MEKASVFPPHWLPWRCFMDPSMGITPKRPQNGDILTFTLLIQILKKQLFYRL